MGLVDKFFSTKLSKDDFAKLVMRDLAAKGIANSTYNQQQFSIHVTDNSNTIFLDNTYMNYCTADKARRTLLLEHLTGSFVSSPSVPDSYSKAIPNLMPIVRQPVYFSLVSLDLRARGAAAKTSTAECPIKPICDGLAALLAYDTEHSIMQINHESFNRWNVSFETALATALDNLREKTDTRLISEEFPGVFRGHWDDSYESARILLTDLIYRVPVEGNPIAFLPSRDHLWLTGSLNLQGLAKLLELGDALHFAAHPVSPRLYVLNNGTWSPYLPEDPSLRDRCLKLIRKREAVDYNQQTEALDAIHARDKIDIFTAKYAVFRLKDGSEYSTCVWTNGIDSLLPIAENITFLINPTQKEFLTVPWALALPIVSKLMEEQPGLLPVRYRVRSFPNSQQCAQLRPLATQSGPS